MNNILSIPKRKGGGRYFKTERRSNMLNDTSRFTDSKRAHYNFDNSS